MARDNEARKTFFEMRSNPETSVTDAIYVMDLIRGGVKNDDPRIPAVLFK